MPEEIGDLGVGVPALERSPVGGHMAAELDLFPLPHQRAKSRLRDDWALLFGLSTPEERAQPRPLVLW